MFTLHFVSRLPLELSRFRVFPLKEWLSWKVLVDLNYRGNPKFEGLVPLPPLAPLLLIYKLMKMIFP